MEVVEIRREGKGREGKERKKRKRKKERKGKDKDKDKEGMIKDKGNVRKGTMIKTIESVGVPKEEK